MIGPGEVWRTGPPGSLMCDAGGLVLCVRWSPDIGAFRFAVRARAGGASAGHGILAAGSAHTALGAMTVAESAASAMVASRGDRRAATEAPTGMALSVVARYPAVRADDVHRHAA